MGRLTRGVFFGAVTMLVACGAAPRKFDATRPITVRSGALSNDYEQEGSPLDREDMVSRLGENPNTAADISTARTLMTLTMVGSAVGGALIGWPLGQALVGREEPMWELAAVGGGVIVVSIPFGLWGESKLGDAVQTHNATLSQ